MLFANVCAAVRVYISTPNRSQTRSCRVDRARPRRRLSHDVASVSRPWHGRPPYRPTAPDRVTAWPRSPAAAPVSSLVAGREIWHAGRGSCKIYRRLIDRSLLSGAGQPSVDTHAHTCTRFPPCATVTRPSKPMDDHRKVISAHTRAARLWRLIDL